MDALVSFLTGAGLPIILITLLVFVIISWSVANTTRKTLTSGRNNLAASISDLNDEITNVADEVSNLQDQVDTVNDLGTNGFTALLSSTDTIQEITEQIALNRAFKYGKTRLQASGGLAYTLTTPQLLNAFYFVGNPTGAVGGGSKSSPDDIELTLPAASVIAAASGVSTQFLRPDVGLVYYCIVTNSYVNGDTVDPITANQNVTFTVGAGGTWVSPPSLDSGESVLLTITINSITTGSAAYTVTASAIF